MRPYALHGGVTEPLGNMSKPTSDTIDKNNKLPTDVDAFGQRDVGQSAPQLKVPRVKANNGGRVFKDTNSARMVEHASNEKKLRILQTKRSNLLKKLSAGEINMGFISQSVDKNPNYIQDFYENQSMPWFSDLWDAMPGRLSIILHQYLISSTEELYSNYVDIIKDVEDFLSTQFNRNSEGFRSLVSDIVGVIYEYYPDASGDTGTYAVSLENETRHIPTFQPKRGKVQREHANALEFYKKYKDLYEKAGVRYQEDLRAYDPALFKALRGFCGSASEFEAVIPKGGEGRAIEILKNEEPGSPRFVEAAKYLGDLYKRKPTPREP